MTNKPTDDSELDEILDVLMFTLDYIDTENMSTWEVADKSYRAKKERIKQAKQAIQRLVLEGRIDEHRLLTETLEQSGGGLAGALAMSEHEMKRLAQLRKQLGGSDE